LRASQLGGKPGFDSRTTPTLSDLQAVIIAQMQKKLQLKEITSSSSFIMERYQDEQLGVIIRIC
jgi:hypothetical protein